MNDLAEMALHGLDTGRRWVRDHPLLPLALSGLTVSTVVVVAGGRVGAARSTTALSPWLGLQDAHGLEPGDQVPGAVMFVAAIVLVGLWFLAVELVRRRPAIAERGVWGLAVAWGAPFALGPALMDTTGPTYVAYGLLQRAGLDPYLVPPSTLGSAPVVAAIDPSSRGVPSAAGPLGSLLQHAAVSASAGSALGALLVLRGVGVLAAVWIGRLAADMGGARRAQALSLTVLNPLVLFYVVSSPHLDGVMVALLLAAVTAANQRRWWTSVALAALAGGFVPVGYLAVPMIIAVHLQRPIGPSPWRRLRGDLVAVAVTVLVTSFLQPNGFGWVRTIDDQFSGSTPYSATGIMAWALARVVPGASYDDVAAGSRITAVVGAAIAVGYLLWTARTRALERTIGYALVALALLAPVVNPWYLLWGAICLAPTALGPRRLWVLGLSAEAALIAPQGFGRTTTHVLTAAVLVAGAAVLGRLLLVHSRREHAPAA